MTLASSELSKLIHIFWESISSNQRLEALRICPTVGPDLVGDREIRGIGGRGGGQRLLFSGEHRG